MIDLVVQKEPSTLITQPAQKIGKNFITYTLFGKKTFHTGTLNLIDVRVLTTSA